jgi:predicted phage terminase large subunit-like protein
VSIDTQLEQWEKKCDVCNEVKHSNLFYRRHPTCKSCLRVQSHVTRNATTLEEKVEDHRVKREVLRLERKELKAIARKRVHDRTYRRKVRAREALEPKIEEHAIEVDAATKELARRELSRRRLIEFVQEFHPRYKAGWVHRDICTRLEKFLADVAAGRSPRLMILMPPRHGKTQLATKTFPAFALGHYNHFEIIACSYNISLALEFSRETRNIVRSKPYTTLFPGAIIDPEIQSAEAWKLVSPTGVGAGGYVAAGIGGPITGKGAHILVIDDPIKNAEEAESLEQRQKIWNWYTSTAYTRLAPGGGVLVIQTCWHDDDLAGRIQQAMKDDPDADQFEIVKYPAIAVEDEQYRVAGEALHAARYDAEALARIKRTIGLRYWAALYQQDPVPDEGAFFTKEMIVTRTEHVDTKFTHIYQAWDFAISEKRQNDWNVGVTIALDYNDVAHIIEMVRFKTNDSAKIVEEMLDMWERHKGRGLNGSGVIALGAEDGQIWRTMSALLKKRMRERRMYPTFEVQKPLTDKSVRAGPLQGRMQNGKVTFPRASPWLEAATKELLRFPSGIHDDIVDALAWAVTLVVSRAPPQPPVYRGAKREKTVEEKVRRLARGPSGGSMAA